MSYTVTILRRAQKELAALPTDVYHKVRDVLRSLAEEPRPVGCLKLKGREGWRIRVWDYRILYEINDDQSTVNILHIGHRRDVYQ